MKANGLINYFISFVEKKTGWKLLGGAFFCLLVCLVLRTKAVFIYFSKFEKYR